jgi:DHA2 family multidrug resistance protein
MITAFHSQLVEHVTPFNDAMRMPDASMLSGHGLPNLAMLEGIVSQQAAAMAYSNDFLFMTLISLAAFPLLALIRSPKAQAVMAPPGAQQAAMRRWIERVGLDAKASPQARSGPRHAH